ncbi:MAG: cupin domain-containing protein [Cyclobacteriaceae bacterium]
MNGKSKKAEETIIETLSDDGTFPNNESLPLILYKGAFAEGTSPDEMEEILHQHGWGNDWRNGIYDYHHYHSTAHEALLIYAGQAEVQLGGPQGIGQKVKAGDVIIIPAGVAHKKLSGSSDFACIGAYPPGQNFDMNYGKEGERPKADENISRLAKPKTDPVYGKKGALTDKW